MLIIPPIPFLRRRRPQSPSAAPPPPPTGSYVTHVHYDPATEYTVWYFSSAILAVDGDPLPFFTIDGYTTHDWDGFEDGQLFTMIHDGEGNPPGPGDIWRAGANSVVQTEHGGVVVGSGEMV